jgi:riboflavin biosynthesis pyrimidine reductase
LARSLISAGLVDRLRFVVPPTLAGHGRRLFDAASTDPLQRFELVDVEQTPAGTLFLHYGRSPE